MNVCILVPAENVENVRDTALTLDFFKDTSREKLMNIALSETGVEPATHFFCSANVNPDLYEKLVALRNFSEMSTDNAKTFLASKNLKVIPNKKEKLSR
jgi:hypothetical protein